MPVKLPKNLAQCADLLFETREKRLALNREADELEAVEKAIREKLIAELPKGDASGIAGKVARVSVVTKNVPRVGNWDTFYAHVLKTKSFELLQKRLNDAAIRERWDDKTAVPGVEAFPVDSISLSKI